MCPFNCPHYPQYWVFTARGPCGESRISSERARFHSTEVGTETGQGNSVPTYPSLDQGSWSGRGFDHPQLSRAVGGCFSLWRIRSYKSH